MVNVAEAETGVDVALSVAENVDAAEPGVDIGVPVVLVIDSITDAVTVVEIEVRDGDAVNVVVERSVLSAVVMGSVVLIIVVKAVEVSLAAADIADAIVAVVIEMTVDVALSVVPENAVDNDTELPDVKVDTSVATVVDSGEAVRPNVLK